MRNNIISIILISILSLISCSTTITYTQRELADPNIMLEKGQRFYLQEEYEKAIKVYKYLLSRKFPIENEKTKLIRGWALYELAYTLYKTRKYSEAIKIFHNIIKNKNIDAKLIKIPPAVIALSNKLYKKLKAGKIKEHSSY